MQPAQPDLVKHVRMNKQVDPGPYDGHSIDRGQRWYLRIAVPVKDHVFCYITGMREICSMVGFHFDLAVKGLLQQGMHFTVAKRPEGKQQSNAGKRKAEKPGYQRNDIAYKFSPGVGSSVHGNLQDRPQSALSGP